MARSSDASCGVCGRKGNEGVHVGLLRLDMVSHGLAKLIMADRPGLGEADYVCSRDLDIYRVRYAQAQLEADRGELNDLELRVLKSMRDSEVLARNVETTSGQGDSFGGRAADRIARFGGSWSFIVLFGGVIVVWITLNSIHLMTKPFDPYPFILLNLALSCLAAMQAPVIMMSQNRKDAKDRLRSEHDYEVNLKAELEVRHLHDKLDHLIEHQWQRLMELQEMQMEMLADAQATRQGRQEA